jgi:diguanylate cyclase (GGDEF)-like protein
MKTNVAVYTNDYVSPEELSASSLFQDVNLAALEGQLNTSPVFELLPGESLLTPNQPNQVLYVLLLGELRVYKDEAKSEQIGTISAGQCIGELSILDRKPTTVFIFAETKCRLLAFDEDRFLELVHSSQGVARNFLMMLMKYLRNKNVQAPENIRLQEKYQRLSSVDELTGVHNRRWLDEMLTRQIMRSSTNKNPLSVVMIAVDGFDTFNEEYGSNAGDQALYSIAQILMKDARPTDLIARYDVEKFVVVLPDTDKKGAEILAARIRRTIGEARVVIPNECMLPPVTVSQGLAQLSAFVSAEKLVAGAMDALERALLKGGNLISD